MEIEKLIDIADPVYTFCEVMDHIDLSGYFVEKDYKTGRPRCDEQKLLEVIQAIMGHRNIETTMDVYAEATERKKQQTFENLSKQDIF